MHHRSHLKFLTCLRGLLCCLLAIPVYSQTYELSTRDAKLTIDKAGVLTIVSKASPDMIVKTSLKNFLRLSLKREKGTGDLDAKVYDFEPGQRVDIRQGRNQIVLSYDKLKKGNIEVDVRAQFTIVANHETFGFSAALGIASKGWLFRELTYPILSTVQVRNNKAKVYWPGGLGQCFEDLSNFGKKSFDYPGGNGSMPWLSINADRSGLYIASHDRERGKKQFNLSYTSQSEGFYSSVTFPIYQSYFQSPEVIVTLYQGTWHEAAKRYRAWYDTQFQIPQTPDWVKKDAGWVSAVLKQQNGYVMWKYDELGKLCDIAETLNFKTIGVFGWASGGYDRLYPNYVPDNLLGGRAALVEAINRAHQRGFRIVLGVNGTHIDAATEYYRDNGNNTISLDEDKSVYLSSVRKYNSATPVILAEASFSSRIWRKTMLELAHQAKELGADGIFYDQLGSKGALLNFSKLQDHKSPQEPATKYKYQMLNEIRSELKKLNPDFALMTDGVTDAIFTDVDYYQSGGEGNYPDANAFPALFKYTFPELVNIQRQPSPMLPRSAANFAAVTGQRHEIQTQWKADVDYITNGRLPDVNSYQDEIYALPDEATVGKVSEPDATKYVRELIKFENEHAEFFRFGKYTDQEGFNLEGKGLLANGFRNGNELGIVVWNQDKSVAKAVQLDVPGYQFVKVSEPGTEVVTKEEPLKPNSVRLLIYRKK